MVQGQGFRVCVGTDVTDVTGFWRISPLYGKNGIPSWCIGFARKVGDSGDIWWNRIAKCLLVRGLWIGKVSPSLPEKSVTSR